MLELGCGDGGNLLPMALALPGSSFVGVDLAPTAIARGRERAETLGAANVELREGDLTALPDDLGEFHFVIAHGVYSWVPPAAREGLMRACGELLAPSGVAYVSYNAYPGSHMRNMAREIMRFHVRDVTDPVERVREARSIMEAIVGANSETPYGRALREHAERMLEQRDWLLFHDDLAEVSTPFWFHEFMAHAAEHGLQFLAEADLFESRIDELPWEVAQTLERAAHDVVLREQYIDFLRNRMFRQTLLCREEVALDREVGPGALRGLSVSAYVVPEGELDLAHDVEVTFHGDAGGSLRSGDALVKAAFAELREAWPGAIGFEELLDRARARTGSARGDTETIVLADVLLRAYVASLVHLHVEPPRAATAAGERPVASALARHQCAEGQELVTTLRHTSVRLDDEGARRLLVLLDGTRDRADLLEAMGEPPSSAPKLDAALARLAQLALLEA